MTSIVDSEAHYERRMREMGMTDAGSRVILRSGLNTYGKLAFAHGRPGVALDEAAFNLFAQATLGAMANLGDTAVLKRLLFESHTLVLAQLKQQVTDPDGSSSRKNATSRKRGSYGKSEATPSRCCDPEADGAKSFAVRSVHSTMGDQTAEVSIARKMYFPSMGD